VIRSQRSLYGTSLLGAGAVHHIKLGRVHSATWPPLETETPNYPPQRQTLESRVRCQFPEAETSAYERNAAISWHFERNPIPYALETDWPVGAAGFEPLHSRMGIGQTLSLGGGIRTSALLDVGARLA
jgi:hypothetical protein